MRFKGIAAIATVALASACAQPEQPDQVYVPVQIDKYGNVVGGTVVDGYLVADDGTVIGPVSPDVDPDGPNGPNNQNRNRNANQSQVTTTTQTRAGGS